MGELLSFIFFVGLILLGYSAGTIVEKRHYRSIEERERALLYLPAVTGRSYYDDAKVTNAWLVNANVVISVDHFKRLLAALRNFFGGRVTSYETLVDRARREALLRIKERASGANMIVNVRIETSAIGQSANVKSTVGSIEAIAYGTAIWLQD